MTTSKRHAPLDPDHYPTRCPACGEDLTDGGLTGVQVVGLRGGFVQVGDDLDPTWDVDDFNVAGAHVCCANCGEFLWASGMLAELVMWQRREDRLTEIARGLANASDELYEMTS